jgi:four helix bundle protein
MEKKYDLEERLIGYASGVIALTESLPNSRAGNHIAAQLLRSGTAPASNYGEAEAAESRKDFLHKMGICLKELRESRIWIRIIAARALVKATSLHPLAEETDELIRIFKASITTARKNASRN